MSDAVKYSDHIDFVEKAIKRIQSCQDIDEALELFEKASERVQICEKKLEDAKGTFEKLKSDDP